MPDQSKKSSRKTSTASRDATSSPASPGGRSRSSLPNGRQGSLFGQGLHRASRGPQRGRRKGRKTPAISGRYSGPSSASVDLTWSLWNKLKEQLGWGTSIEFLQSWKQKGTASGRRYWEHTAYPRHIRGKGSGSRPTPGPWPTPSTEAHGRHSVQNTLEKAKKGVRQQISTQEAARLAAWPTPDTVNAVRQSKGYGPNLRMIASWSTPKASDGSQSLDVYPRGNLTLKGQSKKAVAPWASPAARDYKPEKGNLKPRKEGAPLSRQARGTSSSSTDASTGKSEGVLNPEFSCWLMGYPQEWLQSCPTPEQVRSKRSQMRSSRKSRRNS